MQLQKRFELGSKSSRCYNSANIIEVSNAVTNAIPRGNKSK